MFFLFRPHYRIEHVTELTPQRLSSWGIESLLLDVDSTLKEYRSATPTADVLDWLAEMKRNGIGLCLVSNGRGPRIGRFAESVDVPFVAPAMKPFAVGCRKAMRKMNFDSHKTAMVGDQIFADVAAARLAKIIAILVKPIHPEREPLWTRFKRPFERLLERQ